MQSAHEASRGARTTGRHATSTATQGIDAATTRLGALGRQAQRALLIQIGAAASVGDKVRNTARTYSKLDRVARELNRFERRGARALARRSRGISQR
jgi:hypothetical protein